MPVQRSRLRLSIDSSKLCIGQPRRLTDPTCPLSGTISVPRDDPLLGVGSRCNPKRRLLRTSLLPAGMWRQKHSGQQPFGRQQAGKIRQESCHDAVRDAVGTDRSQPTIIVCCVMTTRRTAHMRTANQPDKGLFLFSRRPRKWR